jgi:hypothetical protein
MSKTTATSSCVNINYNQNPPITISVNTDNYNKNLTPPILPTIINLSDITAPYSIDVTIGGTIASYHLEIAGSNLKYLGTVTNNHNCQVTFPSNLNTGVNSDGIPNATINIVKLDPPTTSPHKYDAGDQYLITMISLSTGTPCTQITFTRNNSRDVDDSICNSKDCFCNSSCTTTRIPLINILGQSMLDGSDVSDMTFTIFDEFTYYEKKNIVNDNQNKCQLLRLKCSDLKETKFIKCCPWMVSVTQGKGDTLNEKLQYLISKNLQPTDMGLNQFLHNMIKYGMTRYILSRILYGKFNIDYLLEKYYKRFITDLGRSRFCRFLEFFENCTISPDFPDSFVGYEKYFLYDKCH